MANPFHKITALFQKNTSVLGIDIGSSSIKVVQLNNKNGQAVLETYGELATGPYLNKAVGQAVTLEPKQIALALSDLFREANVTTKVSALAIPLRSSLLVTMKVPDLPEDKLMNMVPLEARKYIPVPISEVMLDWSIIPNFKHSYGIGNATDTTETKPKNEKGEESLVNELQILVVAIHKDTLQQYEQVALEAKVEAKFLEIETFSTMRASLQNNLSATAIVDLGATTSKLVVVDQGIVRLSHTINKGSQDVTLAIARSLSLSFIKAEEIKREVGLVEKVGEEKIGETISPIMEYIFTEVNQAMVEYQKDNSRSIDKVILIGGGALLKGLLPVAENKLYAPVVLGTPFDRVEAPVFLQDILNKIGPGFAVSLGLALRLLEE